MSDDFHELVSASKDRLRAYEDPDGAFVEHVKGLVSSGEWDVLKPKLRQLMAEAERRKIPAELVQARFAIGACALCGREPCDRCAHENPLWCDVCWKLIEENCPPGQVVSGLAQIMQQITKNLPRRDRQGMLGNEELDPSVDSFRRLQID